jgi:Pyruvate/2-oxoacid:ferredoxin oxidoreductase delta subunit
VVVSGGKSKTGGTEVSEKTVYDRLSEKIFCPNSKLVPELFQMLVDEKDAELMLAMPGPVSELARNTGRSEEDVENSLKDLFRKGLVFKSRKPEGIKYRMCRDLVQFHDASIVWPEASQEFFDLWQKYMESEWPDYARMAEKVVKKPLTRIIPVDRAIEARQQVLAYENVRQIIEDANRLAVTKCTCRTIARKCDNPIDVCLQVNRGADYTVERGSGREITKEEALKILDECEEAGLVHLTVNRADVGNYICNCCSCCCEVLPMLIQEGVRLVDPSRYLARVDEELCTGCEVCLDRCVFNAIEMIKKDGSELARINAEKCMGCGLCVIKCPTEAIALEETRDKEFIPQ